VGAELFRGRTHMTKLTVAFRNFQKESTGLFYLYLNILINWAGIAQSV
jgi:hypothetical protein